LAYIPLALTARLDRVLLSAARLIGVSEKFTPLSGYMHDTSHWLPIPKRIFYRVAVLVWHCLIGFAPVYLHELRRPCIDPGWPSSVSFLLWWKTLVPRVNTSTNAAPSILNCCSFYLDFTSLADSIVTKELHAFALQAA